MNEYAIDWTALRKRIAQTPVVVPPRRQHKKSLSPEAAEARRVRARERWTERYRANPEKYRAMQKKWEAAHPDRVKAKRQRFYERHKTDPEWMENHRRKNREYKARKKAERLAATAPPPPSGTAPKA